MRLPVSRIAFILAAAAGLPGLAHAGVYSKGHCQLTVPDGWVASKTRISSPDKSRWANLIEAPSSDQAVKLEASMGAKPVSDAGGMVLMTRTASFGGKTNRMYHAISKGSPSCLADVTFPDGVDDAGAKRLALTVKVVK
jgi:hypothetical protein